VFRMMHKAKTIDPKGCKKEMGGWGGGERERELPLQSQRVVCNKARATRLDNRHCPSTSTISFPSADQRFPCQVGSLNKGIVRRGPFVRSCVTCACPRSTGASLLYNRTFCSKASIRSIVIAHLKYPAFIRDMVRPRTGRAVAAQSCGVKCYKELGRGASNIFCVSSYRQSQQKQIAKAPHQKSATGGGGEVELGLCGCGNGTGTS
jgi:hypothetical protein